MEKLTCFKAYDIRGKLGSQLNEDIAYRIGRAYCQWLKPVKVVVGGDARATSADLKNALAKGLMDGGADVIDIGMVGTEEVYFATRFYGVDGGIQVTASHNPIDYNGMKLVKKDAQPISGDNGLYEIQKLAQDNYFAPPVVKGQFETQCIREHFVEHLLSYIDLSTLKPMKIVVNAGNGAAGPTLDALEAAMAKRQVPISFIKINHQPDSRFPNGIPNPMLAENQWSTRQAVCEHQADLGIAWDGDFDRCFFFDNFGNFIEGYYIVGVLAERFLRANMTGEITHNRGKIIHDPRLIWNTVDIVQTLNGTAIESKTGHAFIKDAMRHHDAIYGGEMSAHHYFRDFGYCDSGMIPWLLVIELLSHKATSLFSLIESRKMLFPVSGELNFTIDDPATKIQQIKQFYVNSAIRVTEIDGLSMEFEYWRFNIRASNTEPLVRLNIETRSDKDLLEQKVTQLTQLLQK
ncbi:phosphomannomutase/phosphoglucomutase [Yersinia kristensenii]|uniref:phosphomannomutase/phosphoglucomutase n=1 Tax=Yersinia kristensenii TaxID=28152 RepID=UPI0001A5403D|nr:phosphomannomutase/phosphoglucomutase [Yersinia kristensenii]EEP91316.1 Phosphomannomutase [Yersinia kristensenii ATCC 33638]MBW5827517.1 phosphomannomutase/phosphoglucomutase [Yersinia kristensenii]PEH54957.1 phosphomannomutase/phosphoglucomutase [Yersinia kristensenii]SUP68849.1 phosphomannomutase [Yersinia kristensenii]